MLAIILKKPIKQPVPQQSVMVNYASAGLSMYCVTYVQDYK